ncbi:hypothetical protein LCGC14_2161150 [marine sediment metagenome]|uniref:Uncharacterized protein n=1 Tax=marine sediment metagenome TaxID=412755 RepID=A0A0F9EF20_9ZZZZ
MRIVKDFKIEESFPPSNKYISWDLVVIFAKMPDLLSTIKSKFGDTAYVKFTSKDYPESRGIVTEDEDFEGALDAYSTDGRYMSIAINTVTKDQMIMVAGGLNSIKEIEQELKD